MTNLKQKVAKGAVWTLMEKFSVQFVNFFVAMILARLLTPTDYGTVALTNTRGWHLLRSVRGSPAR